jgi:hypothetical protein
VPALLGQQLILDLYGRCAGIFERTHHVHHVEYFAVARIAVDEHRQSRCARDLAHEEAHLIERDDADVG